MTVTIANNRGWPIPWIFLEDYCPADFPLEGQNKRLATLMPGRAITLKYTLTCPRRGYHRIGPILMESGDLFGLQKRFRTGEQREYVSVLPTIAYIDTFNISSKRPQGPVRISNRVYADPTRIHSIREYVPGDPMNTIHWKATARTGTLHVKTHEPFQRARRHAGPRPARGQLQARGQGSPNRVGRHDHRKYRLSAADVWRNRSA